MGNTLEMKYYYNNTTALNELRTSLSNPNVEKIYIRYIGREQSKPEVKPLFIYAIVIDNCKIHHNYYFNGKKEMFSFINSIKRPYIIDKQSLGGAFIRFVYNVPTTTPTNVTE